MISVEDAVGLLSACSHCIKETEKIPLMEGLGRTLAVNVTAPMDQPPFPRSPLDGYAIRAEDSMGATPESPVCLEVIGEVCAGQVFRGCVGSGQAVRIMTGAPIPEGADTVIKQENTDYGDKQVNICENLVPYGNYCACGEDYCKGDILLEKGTILDSAAIGTMAGAGMTVVDVYRQPRVGVISTGDEVLSPGSVWQPGKIYDSNLYLIGARLRELGIIPVWMLHCGDQPEKMTELIRNKVKEVDLLVTTGGVSVGKKDIMHEVIRLLPARKLFWKVAVKPGAPVLGAVYSDVPVICLSGNPFGAASNFELLVRPVLAKMTGNSRYAGKRIKAVFDGEFLKSSSCRRFLRGYYENGRVRMPQEKHASGILSSLIGCNCMIDIESGSQGLHQGDMVQVLLF
ncbi:MAG: gephyrin-like molybdotransferase Glp [Coprococcus sp.]